MSGIEIYVTPFCPYCHRALALLKRKQVRASVIDIFRHPRRRREMEARAGGRTSVPQIFIEGLHLGGCDDLHALDRRAELDPLIAKYVAAYAGSGDGWDEAVPLDSVPAVLGIAPGAWLYQAVAALLRRSAAIAGRLAGRTGSTSRTNSGAAAGHEAPISRLTLGRPITKK